MKNSVKEKKKKKLYPDIVEANFKAKTYVGNWILGDFNKMKKLLSCQNWKSEDPGWFTEVFLCHIFSSKLILCLGEALHAAPSLQEDLRAVVSAAVEEQWATIRRSGLTASAPALPRVVLPALHRGLLHDAIFL